MRYKYSKLYWFFKDLSWMKVYFSPFKPFLPKLYIGKTAVGCPWFLPRKMVKATPERAHKAVEDYIEREESYNKLNPNSARKIKPYDEVFANKMKYTYTVPLKVGFSSCSLGWKTKWTSTDFRHEWNPVWSFVCFGYQIALIFRPEDDVHYWECYIAYEYDTDKSKSPKERLKEVIKKHPCTWTSHSDEGKITTNYWELVIREKYKNG